LKKSDVYTDSIINSIIKLSSQPKPESFLLRTFIPRNHALKRTKINIISKNEMWKLLTLYWNLLFTQQWIWKTNNSSAREGVKKFVEDNLLSNLSKHIHLHCHKKMVSFLSRGIRCKLLELKYVKFQSSILSIIVAMNLLVAKTEYWYTYKSDRLYQSLLSLSFLSLSSLSHVFNYRY